MFTEDDWGYMIYKSIAYGTFALERPGNFCCGTSRAFQRCVYFTGKGSTPLRCIYIAKTFSSTRVNISKLSSYQNWHVHCLLNLKEPINPYPFYTPRS